MILFSVSELRGTKKNILASFCECGRPLYWTQAKRKVDSIPGHKHKAKELARSHRGSKRTYTTSRRHYVIIIVRYMEYCLEVILHRNELKVSNGFDF